MQRDHVYIACRRDMGVYALRDPRKHSARRSPPASPHSDLEAGGRTQMPIMPNAAILTTRAHVQADKGTRNRALRLVASDDDDR
jgi:hypothetical protein